MFLYSAGPLVASTLLRQPRQSTKAPLSRLLPPPLRTHRWPRSCVVSLGSGALVAACSATMFFVVARRRERCRTGLPAPTAARPHVDSFAMHYLRATSESTRPSADKGSDKVPRQQARVTAFACGVDAREHRTVRYMRVQRSCLGPRGCPEPPLRHGGGRATHKLEPLRN